MNDDTTSADPAPPPALAARLRAFNDWMSRDLGGGPRPWKLAWIINFQKGGTVVFLGALMLLYGNTTTAAWIYLALHGSYGIVWLIKDLSFPDPAWQGRATLAGGFVAFGAVLAWYWAFGWLLIASGVTPDYPLPEAAWYALCISLCVIGCVIMVAADAQKYYTLRLRPGLITDGMFSRVRHPNYLGEMMIYGSFALMVWHWLPFVVLAVIWSALFAVNMIMKEASLSRHPGWAAYRARTGWLLPRLVRPRDPD